MSIATGLIDGLDAFLDWFSSSAKASFSDYCELETAERDDTLVTKDGCLVSLIQINGLRNLTSNKSYYDNIVQPLNTSIQNYFSADSHAIQVWFEVDPDRTKEDLEETLSPSMQTAKKYGLDMDDFFEQRINNLCTWIQSEKCYMALWTKPKALSKGDLKAEKERLQKEIKPLPPTKRTQNPIVSVSLLSDRHRSFVSALQDEFNGVGISTKLLHVKDAVREIRNSVDKTFTSHDWEAALPGDRVVPHIHKYKTHVDQWDIVWPKLGWQICPRDANIVSDNVVKIGDRLYSPLYISLFPKEVSFFGGLLARCKEKGLPWRASFMLEGSGLNAVSFKAMLASILAFSSNQNKLINDSIKALRIQQNETGDCIIKLRASFCTWANKVDKDGKENKSLIAKRTSDLARSIESWGSSQVAEITGDPIAGFASAALGMTSKNVGTAAAAPLEEVLCMLPFTRPASPWEYGAVSFRSPDGKLMPYQPYSSMQTTWINLIFAKPGSGKSVLMNVCNLALCLLPGFQRLPRIAIIDIGPSSSGLISLIKEALPNDKKHLATYQRLRMTKDYSINPFDTQLGCRFPSATERAFLINFLTLIATDMNAVVPPTGMTGLVTDVLEDMYRKKSDAYEPNRYTSGLDYKVDDMVNKLNMPIDNKTTWWEIVDYLFDHGYVHEASLAQRYAVPLLADVSGSAKAERIKNTYNITIDTGESLSDALTRMIANSLEYYPIFARPTIFDLGEARIISLDLDEVAKSGGVVADRMTAVMYMLARHVTARNFYLKKETINEIPASSDVKLPSTVPIQKYKDFHRKRIEEIVEDPKRICYDEFHRTSKAQAVRDQVLLDMREGRKWQVDVMLASQALEDFDKTMIEFATGIFVMDGGNQLTINAISDIFGFSDPAERYALQHRVHGPKAGGGTFMAKFFTTSGQYTMLLSATLGPVELWAFSTTTEDAVVRNTLYEKLGPNRARKILGRKYPGGSCKKDVENRKDRMRLEGMSVDTEGKGILQSIVDELLELNKEIPE